MIFGRIIYNWSLELLFAFLSNKLNYTSSEITDSLWNYITRQQNYKSSNYKGSISAYDEHAGSRNCDSHGNLEKKPPESTNVRNLYGSTPSQPRHHVTSNLGKNDFSKAGRAIDIFHTDPRSINQLDFNEFDNSFEPGHIANDYVGPAMELVSNVYFLQI